MASREHFARALWTLFEPIHAVTYFSDEARAEFSRAATLSSNDRERATFREQAARLNTNA